MDNFELPSDQKKVELSEQIEQLQRLMAAISVEDKNSDSDKEDAKNFVYDFSSGDELNEEDPEDIPVNVKIEDIPESSRKRSYDGNYNPEYTRYKYQKIPKKYTPVTSHMNDITLNIDCSDDPASDIKRWFNKQNVLITITEELRNLSNVDTFYYLVYKTEGNAHKFLQNLDGETMSSIPADHKQVDNWVQQLLIKEFVGFTETPESQLAVSQNNLYRINNLSICNMCMVDNFICEFSDYYYGISPDLRREKSVNDLFFMKLPKTVSEEVDKYFRTSLALNQLADTLGGRIKALRLWLTEQCNKKIAIRQAQVGLCCDKIQDKIGHYGCKTRKSSKKKRKVFKKIKKSRRKIFKRKKKGFFPFRKRNPKRPSYQRKNACPTGKKKCTCWVCHEEGHYANECPKNKGKEMVKLIYDLGFEPIESDFSSDESIYELVTDSSDGEEDFE